VDQERTILVVDDDADVVTALESTLGDRGYDIRQASRWTEAIAEIQEHRPDAVLLDLYLPTVQGEALLEFIRDFDPSLPVVIVSSEIEPGKLEQLGRMGANGFVRKPFSEDDLFVVVEQVLSEVEANKADATTQSEDLGPVATPTVAESPKILPGAGVERLERDRPEIEAAPTRRTRRRGRRKFKIKSYLIAFLICLVTTWLLFMAQEMLSQGFFGMEF
jgi:DNA-binding NtrC family response regulator